LGEKYAVVVAAPRDLPLSFSEMKWTPLFSYFPLSVLICWIYANILVCSFQYTLIDYVKKKKNYKYIQCKCISHDVSRLYICSNIWICTSDTRTLYTCMPAWIHIYIWYILYLCTYLIGKGSIYSTVSKCVIQMSSWYFVYGIPAYTLFSTCD
jgi:hypothetical protein